MRPLELWMVTTGRPVTAKCFSTRWADTEIANVASTAAANAVRREGWIAGRVLSESMVIPLSSYDLSQRPASETSAVKPHTNTGRRFFIRHEKFTRHRCYCFQIARQ